MGGGNSLGLDNEVFLERFRDKPNGIIVSAQILLEGYDDPAIDAVVMTYPSQSLIKLMQSAGRAVASSVGRQIGNQILRGILGGFMRGR